MRATSVCGPARNFILRDIPGDPGMTFSSELLVLLLFTFKLHLGEYS